MHGSKQSMGLTAGLEEELVRENITTIGEQVDVFRSAYARVFPPSQFPPGSPLFSLLHS